MWRRSAALAFGIGAAVLAALLSIATLPAAAAVFGPPRFVLLYTYFGRFFEFFVGVWLAKRLAALPASRTGRAWPAWTLAGAVGIVGVIFALAALGQSDPTSSGLYRPGGIALNNLVLPLFIARSTGALRRSEASSGGRSRRDSRISSAGAPKRSTWSTRARSSWR